MSAPLARANSPLDVSVSSASIEDSLDLDKETPTSPLPSPRHSRTRLIQEIKLDSREDEHCLLNNDFRPPNVNPATGMDAANPMTTPRTKPSEPKT